MTPHTPSHVPEKPKHWAEELLKWPKKDLVYIMMANWDDIKEAVIDYSEGVFKRLTDVLENTKSKTLKIIDASWEDFWVNLNHTVWVEIKSCQWKQIILDPEKLADNKPVEIELILSNWIWLRWTIYLKTANDIHKRTNSTSFLNIINIYEFSRRLNWERVWKHIPFKTMSINTDEISTIKKKKDLYKMAKVWVVDADSRIRWKKKQIEKIVPLDYVEETNEWNNMLWNSMISR